GGFSQYLDKATEIWGVEPSETVKFPFFRVLRCTYDEAYADLPDAYFDLIICNDVIEHLPDTDHFLQTIKKKMDPNGMLIGSIPNVRYYRNLRSLIFSGQWEYTDSGILDRTHLRFFTEKSLRGTFSRNQMKIERFERINGVKGFKVFIFFLNLITFNRCSDTRYLQFAFRISKN
ncbi:MAG: class I SAM-dependent methyltransferase, partial [Pseudomonadales bacterium]|nr:class I SAM-dependent methyltransferase [Pseudomonadales bacterium]